MNRAGVASWDLVVIVAGVCFFIGFWFGRSW